MMMVTRRAMARAVALIHLLVARTGCGSASAEGGAPTASVGGGNGTTAVATTESWPSVDELRGAASPKEMLKQLRTASGQSGKPEPLTNISGGFVIVTVQRTGSTWLVEELDKHPCIMSSKEIFLNNNKVENIGPNMTAEYIAKKYSGFKWSAGARREAMDRLYSGGEIDHANSTASFRNHARHCRTGGKTVCGFKWMLSQHFGDDWRDWFRDFCARHGIALVFLTRRNVLRVRVSQFAKDKLHESIHAAAQTQYDFETGPTLLRELDKIENRYKDMARMANEAEAAGLQTMHLTYEDVVANTSETLDAVATFALKRTWCQHDVKHHWYLKAMGASQGQKVHGNPLRTYIRNWADIEATLTGTPYEPFLREE